jgi:TRAP-type C4-dicarboxylate transport system substrate-binding protein
MKMISVKTSLFLMILPVIMTFYTGASLAEETKAVSTEKFQLHVASVTVDNDQDAIVIPLKKFMAEVERRTNGNITFTFHAGGSLGVEQDYLEMMGTGDLAFANCATANFATLTDQLLFLDTPMLFKSFDHLNDFLKSDVARKRLDTLEKIGLEAFGGVTIGARNFLTSQSHPINSVADMKDLKIRVMPAHMFVEGIKALGGMAAPMPYNECYQALQTGVIDGMDNQVATYMSMRFYEVAPNYAMLPWFQLTHIFVGSKTIIDSLPADYQQIIREAANNAIRETNEWSREWNQTDAVKMLTDLGVKLTYPDFNEFRERLIPIHEQNRSIIGDDVFKWLEENPGE